MEAHAEEWEVDSSCHRASALRQAFNEPESTADRIRIPRDDGPAPSLLRERVYLDTDGVTQNRCFVSARAGVGKGQIKVARSADVRSAARRRPHSYAKCIRGLAR